MALIIFNIGINKTLILVQGRGSSGCQTCVINYIVSRYDVFAVTFVG